MLHSNSRKQSLISTQSAKQDVKAWSGARALFQCCGFQCIRAATRRSKPSNASNPLASRRASATAAAPPKPATTNNLASRPPLEANDSQAMALPNRMKNGFPAVVDEASCHLLDDGASLSTVVPRKDSRSSNLLAQAFVNCGRRRFSSWASRLGDGEGKGDQWRKSNDTSALQDKVGQLERRLKDFYWRVESANYLNWLNGIAPESRRPNHGVCSPNGLWADLPNPYLSAIRHPDIELRRVLAQHANLCTEGYVVPEEVALSLRTSEFNNWAFTDEHLIRLVRQMFVDLDLTTPHLPICVDELDRWLAAIYARYNQVPFHNFKHAFMVTQMSYAIIWNAGLNVHLTKLDQLTLISAAINHDLDHPGFNNAYQINAGTQLAMRYNDRSPLENHHASTAFEILYGAQLNPFAGLEPRMQKDLREGMIRCILATDMSCHSDILSQFKENILSEKEAMLRVDPNTGRPVWASNKQHLNIVMSILIKVSDISNESRPLDVATPWIDRLLEEFFQQSDYEKSNDLPHAPFMDRDKVTKPESQFSFITYVIMPLFQSLCELFPELNPVLLEPAKNQLDYYTSMISSS